MNHDEGTVLFDGLGEAVDSRPPLTDLLRAGRAAERRRRRTAVAGSVAAVLLVLGGGVATEQLVGADDATPVPADQAEPPVAPDGMRYVGRGRVVMAVPESWSTGATRCGVATEATVWFPGVVDFDCPNPPHGFVPQLKIGALSTPFGSRLFDHTTPTESRLADGTVVTEAPVLCMDSFPESCSFQVAVPSEDSYFVLSVPDMSKHRFVQEVRDSLRVLPEGFTTVPAIDVGSTSSDASLTLTAAGLKPRTPTPDVNLDVVASDPAAGSVVRLGAVVTLLSRGDSGSTREQTAAATRIAEPDGAEPVNELADVIGTWQLANGELGLSIGRNGKRYYQAFPIDCNSGSQPLRLDADGIVRLGGTVSTLIGCVEDREYPQPHPLAEGQRLFLGPEGQLLAVAPTGSVAATYVRSGQ